MRKGAVGYVLVCIIAAGALRCQKPGGPGVGNDAPAGASRQVRLTLSLKVNRDVWVASNWSKPPQIAVWLEDEAGPAVRTLFVTHCTGGGDWKGKADCPVSLPCWVGRYCVEHKTAGPPTFQRPAPDAVTGATPKESLTVRRLVPAGSRWRYFVEVNASGDFNEAFPEALGGGQTDEAGNGQPSLVYAGSITAAIGRKDTPTILGRTDQLVAVEKLLDDLEGITTARKLLSDIVMSVEAAPAAAERAGRHEAR